MSKIKVLIGSTYKSRSNGALYTVYHVDEGVRTPGSEPKIVPIVYLELKTKPFLSYINPQFIMVPANHLSRLFIHYQNPDGRYIVEN